MMNKNLIGVAAAAAILLGSTAAYACPTCGSHGGGGGGDTDIHNTNTVNNTNVGVNRNYNNNFNRNTNLNANLNSNTNNNTNNNNNSNTNTNNNNSQASAQASSSANANSSSSGGSGGSSTVNVSGNEAAASGAAPVYLTSSNDTCMGSTGIGGQGMSFGFSIGTTWTDSNCIMLKNSRELRAQGHDKAAKARLCMDSDNALAFQLAGDPCPQALKTAQEAVAQVRAYDAKYKTAAAKTSPATTQTAELPSAPAASTGTDAFDTNE